MPTDNGPGYIGGLNTGNSNMRAFLDSIKDNPHDRDTQLIFADWLEENSYDKEATAWRNAIYVAYQEIYGFYPNKWFVLVGGVNGTVNIPNQSNEKYNLTINFDTGRLIKFDKNGNLIS